MSRKVILDECLPKRLKRIFEEEEVTTVREAGHAGMKNGRLLEAISGVHDVFLTVDTKLPDQQNLSRFSISIVLIRAVSNDIHDLLPLTEQIRNAVARVAPGELVEVSDMGTP